MAFRVPQPLPPISVVTPVYNAGLYIAETVESVLAQEYPDFEHVILDDGSTDTTLSVLSAYRDRIRLHSQPNAGEARAVNRLVGVASHDIVGIVNADDPVLPGLLKAVGQAFAGDPELSAVYPDWIWIDQSGAMIREMTTLEFDLSVMLEQHLCIPGPGAFFRKSRLGSEAIRVVERGTNADFDFWLRFGLHGRIRRIPCALATWRYHTAGTTSLRRDRGMAEDKIGVIKAFFERKDLPSAICALEAQALSAAYFNAGLLALRGANVPAARYFLKSFTLKPIWPKHILRSQRRSLKHMAYAALQPLSGRLHELLSPALPERFSWQAVVGHHYGVTRDG